MQWKNAQIAITGAGSGIGRALAHALARRGAHLWLTDIDEQAAQTVRDEIGGGEAQGMDVRDADAFRRHIDSIVDATGRIDVLFNNAGIGIGGDALDLELEHYDRSLDVNVRGVVHGVLAAQPHMTRQRSGVLVNVASAAGLLGVPLMAPYSMSKFAVVGLSRSLRVELAEHGVQVCVLCPTAIETPLLDKPLDPVDDSAIWRPDIRRYLTKVGGAPFPVDRFVERALRRIEKNHAVIVEPGGARVRIALARWFPGLVETIGRRAYREEIAGKPASGS